MNARPIRAVVLAAGKGTRMKSSQPKVLHEICGRPMVWYTLQALHDAGVSEVTLVTNAQLEAHVDELRAGFSGILRSVVQEPQLGTGHAVRVALEAMAAQDAVLVVAYGDMPLVPSEVFAQAIARIGADGAALALTTARMPLPSNFGRIVRRGQRVEKIVEARDCTPQELALDEMNAGIYAYDERALREAIVHLRDDNVQKEYYLTDTVALLLAAGRDVVPVPCEDFRMVLGVNDRAELAKARAILNERLCVEHMRNGVTIIDPATTYLEPGIVIGNDTTVWPNTFLCGATTIGRNCTIGPNSRLFDTTLGDGVHFAYSVASGSLLAEGVSVGPFAHLRAGATLEAGVHVGNYVEIKKSTLGEGAKAGHLTYLGDATIGARANIGAGTITCNYDGERKHETHIGEGAFIGSNSSLVAPVRIGDGAATGAGAVVIRDVPDGERVVGNPGRALPRKTTV